LTELQGQTLKPRTHPVFKKYEVSEKLDVDSYWKIHTDFLVPTQFKIDINTYNVQIDKYRDFFKSWGQNKPELNQIRKGLPLVNLDGSYTNKTDISIGPLDDHNSRYPENCYLENDFTVHTDILNLSCFDVLDPIKQYLCRSSILGWNEGANFSPHWDIILPTVNLRLWGTNNPDNIRLRYKQGEDMLPCVAVEPGRLYLIETSTVHDARCVKDAVDQFFIALNVYSYDTLKNYLR
tara:strand:- start:124 stop:831 length:708 start_codon:yes stop_codon:yes gene_type:complete